MNNLYLPIPYIEGVIEYQYQDQLYRISNIRIFKQIYLKNHEIVFIMPAKLHIVNIYSMYISNKRYNFYIERIDDIKAKAVVLDND